MGSLVHLLVVCSHCLSLFTQRTEDLPAKVPAKSCLGGSPAAHGPSGGSLPHAKEQLPKYQVKHPLQAQ